MLRNSALTIVFCLFQLSISAGWTFVDTSIPSNNDIVDLCFVDDDLGWALVDESFSWTIFRTTDGGDTWTDISTGEEDLSSGVGFQFFSETNGWLWLGESRPANLLRTTDGGETWTIIPTPFDDDRFGPNVYSAHFFDDQTGWIAGDGDDDDGSYMLAKTIDGGDNWEISRTPFTFDAADLTFRDDQLGVVVGGFPEIILVTQDGGENWFVPNYTAASGFREVEFDSSGTGFIGASQGVFLQSTDNGANWLAVNPPLSSEISFDAILPTSTGELFIGANDGPTGYLFRPDAGWIQSSLPFIVSQGSRFPRTINVLYEKPDGTILAGGRGLLRLENVTSPEIALPSLERNLWNLPNGVAGERWIYSLAISGGVGALSFQSPNLPSGLSLDSQTGIISGTPSQTGLFMFDVSVEDSASQTDEVTELRLRIVPNTLTFESSSLEPMTHRLTNRRALNVSGGNLPYKWRVIDGALPEGVTIEGEGILAGTPQEIGDFSFTLEVLDSSGLPLRDTAAFNLTVDPLAEDTWEVQSAHNRLTTIHFFDENEGIAGGWSSIFFRTKNGGRTWDPEPSFDIFDGPIISAEWSGDVGLATSSLGIFRSTDRGVTWELVFEQNDSPDDFGPLEVRVFSANLAIAYSDFIFRSTDGGQTWTQSTIPDLQNQRLFDLEMGTETLGWASQTNYGLYKTTDGGITWTAETIEGLTIPSTTDLLGLAAIGNSVWIGSSLSTGFGWAVFHTSDSGTTWEEQSVGPGVGFLTNVDFLDEQVGFANGINRGTIAKTTNGGQSWSRKSLWANNASPMESSFLDQDNGWLIINGAGRQVNSTFADAQGSIWKTTDGGDSWITQFGTPLRDGARTLEDTEFTTQYPGANFRAISFPTQTTGFALMQDPAFENANSPRLIRTDNGGATWQDLVSVRLGSLIQFTSEQHGWIINTEDTISSNAPPYETRDGGKTWILRNDIFRQVSADLITTRDNEFRWDDLQFINDQVGWISGYGSILGTTDAGRTWEVLDTDNFEPWDIYFTDAMNGWRVSREIFSNVIERTSDGGRTWIPTATKPDGVVGINRIISVSALDANTAALITNQGNIATTSDGGMTWQVAMYSDDPTPVWEDIDFYDCITAFGLGHRPRADTDNVGLPILAATSTADFTNTPEQTFGLTNHAFRDFTSRGSTNAWALGTYGMSLKFSASTDSIDITTDQLPIGLTGAPYNAMLETNADPTETITWELCGPSLPDGLTLSSAGEISGTPNESGTFQPIFIATDTQGEQATRPLILEINSNPDITITNGSPLTQRLEFEVFQINFQATNGTAPYTWEIIEGELPPGVTLNDAGQLFGSSSQSGTYEFTIEARENRTDGFPNGFARKEFELTITTLPVPLELLPGWLIK